MKTTQTHNTVIALFTKQETGNKASAFLKVAKSHTENSVHLLPSLVFHTLQHGDHDLLNRVLNAVSSEQRKFMIQAIMDTKAFNASTVINGKGERQYVKRIGGNKPADHAEKIALTVVDWRILQQADKATKAANREAKKLEKAAAAAEDKKQESEEALKLEAASGIQGVQGVQHIRYALQELHAKIKAAVSSNTVALSDVKLASDFIAWYAKQETQQAEQAQQAPSGIVKLTKAKAPRVTKAPKVAIEKTAIAA